MDLALDSQLRTGFITGFSRADAGRELVRFAESNGFDSIWVGDHIAFPVPIMDCLAQLACLAGMSERLTLGTGVFLAQAAQASLPVGVVPAVIFLLACFIAFSTGTSWGTFAIMIPIVMPMVTILGLHPALAVAAALGGGIFGDHCSPISDTTIVASMASATDHIDHVRTQLPYALVAAGGAVVLFVVFGFVL